MKPEDAQRFRQQPDDDASFEPIPPTEASYAYARRRVAQDERFMGHILYERQQRTGETDEMIARELGLPVEQLGRLSLWMRPRTATSEQFQDDIQQIVRAFDLNAKELTRMVRDHDVMRAFRGASNSRPLLAAARDHDEPTPQTTIDDNAEADSEKSQDREP